MEPRWWLLPGTLCTAEVFAPLLGALGIGAEKCRAVPLDRPHVNDYSADLAAVRSGDVVLAFSLGAILLAHHLDRLAADAVVLLAANPFADLPEKRDGRLAMLAQARSFGIRGVLAQSLPAQLGRAAGAHPEITEMILDMAEVGEAQFAAQTDLALSRPGAERAIAQSRPKLLFLTGSEDSVAPASRARRAASLGDHRFALIEGAGHYLPLEAPDACARHIREFMRWDGA